MEIVIIDSATILIDGITFSKSESTGQYFSTSPDCTDKHRESIKQYEQGVREDNLKPYEESLAGLFINLN